MNTNLPKSVPFLMPRKICRNLWHGRNGTHCLHGWVIIAFDDSQTRTRVIDLLSKERPGQILSINDDPGNPKTKLADLWNRAMRSLGYVKRGKKFVMKGAK